MKKHVAAVVGATTILATSIGFAGPVVAAPTDAAPTVAAQTYEMPRVRGMNLQQAVDAIHALNPEAKFRITTFNIKGYTQKQLSLPNWVVCTQSPGAGRNITPSKTKINIGVVRPNENCKV